MSVSVRVLLAVLIGGPTASSSVAGSTLYAVDFNSAVLLEIDAEDGNAITIGPLGTGFMTNIAWVDGRMLGMDHKDGLYEINLETGQAVLIAPLPDGYESGGALAYDIATNQVYAALAENGDPDQRALVILDPETGRLIQAVGTLPTDGDGMAIDPQNGQMYVLSVSAPITELWRINKSDATGVNLGVTGLDRPQAMAFHPCSNTLFVAEGGLEGQPTKSLFTLDPDDLSSELIGSLDYLGISGLAFVPGPVGDIDGDGGVGQSDLGILLAFFGLCEGDPAFYPSADLNCDGCIHQEDLGLLLSHFGD